jgi:hypothetical protein
MNSSSATPGGWPAAAARHLVLAAGQRLLQLLAATVPCDGRTSVPGGCRRRSPDRNSAGPNRRSKNLGQPDVRADDDLTGGLSCGQDRAPGHGWVGSSTLARTVADGTAGETCARTAVLRGATPTGRDESCTHSTTVRPSESIDAARASTTRSCRRCQGGRVRRPVMLVDRSSGRCIVTTAWQSQGQCAPANNCGQVAGSSAVSRRSPVEVGPTRPHLNLACLRTMGADVRPTTS